MNSRTTRKIAIASMAGLLAVALPPAAAAQAAPRSDPGPQNAVAAGVAAYRRVYPEMTERQARDATLGQESRQAVVAELVATRADTYGGAWFDPPTAVLHVAATTTSTAALAETLGRDRHLTVQTHLVERSFSALENQAEGLRGGRGALGRAAEGQVGIDVAANQVTVAPRTAVTAGSAPAGVTLRSTPVSRPRKDAACTSRVACDLSLRSGAMMWWGPDHIPWCSIGFTARNSQNQRVLYTSGHCKIGIGETWGTGDTEIGLMGPAEDSGAVDGATIAISDPAFASQPGGEIFLVNRLTLPVRAVLSGMSSLIAGQVVCLSSNFSEPNAPSRCGIITSASDPAGRGMTRVTGVDACLGDSGGGWYWLPASGRISAYGIHSTSDEGCHGSEGGNHSWFSPMPLVQNAVGAGYSIELR